MAGIILEMANKAKPRQGYKKAKEILESGQALKKFQQIVKIQGKSKYELRTGKHKIDFKSNQSGTIKAINNKEISKLARIAGAPIDKYAGVFMHSKIGAKVQKDQLLYTVYSDSKNKLNEVKKLKLKPFKIN